MNKWSYLRNGAITSKGNKVIAESGKIVVLAESVESFLFDDTPAGVSWIELEPKDDLDVDNFALANNIYSDLIGTPAAANFWTNGTDCRASDGSGALGTATSC